MTIDGNATLTVNYPKIAVLLSCFLIVMKYRHNLSTKRLQSTCIF